jgi:thymidylate synthase
MKKYLELLEDIQKFGVKKENRTGVSTQSIHARQLRVRPAFGFPLLTTKRLHFKSIFAEWLWMMLGHTDAQFLKDRNVTIWDEWSTYDKCEKFNRMVNDLGPIYGHLWRNFGGKESPRYGELFDRYNSLTEAALAAAKSPQEIEYIKTDAALSIKKDIIGDLQYGALTKGNYFYPFLTDGYDQIAWLLKELKFNPDSRRLIVSGWDPKAANEVELPPCHTMWQFTTFVSKKERVLSLHLNQRSADAFLGIPYNVAFYALTQHIFATIMGYRIGELVITGVDMHLYSNHSEQTEEQLSRDPLSLPTLHIEKWAENQLAKFGRSIQKDTPLRDIGRMFDEVLTQCFLEPMDNYWRDPAQYIPTIKVDSYNAHPSIKADVAV